MKRAVTELQKRSPDTTFICLSNSNEIYIDTILKVSISIRIHPHSAG
jgi:pyridoxal phosphate phosphatase PHOSPHO2